MPLKPLGQASSPTSPKPYSDAMEELRRRDGTTTYMSTCGFLSGNPSLPRTANSGFDCRTDTINGLWGFCPTTVIYATDCGLAGNCVDNHGCTSGCGIFGTPSITTFTCTLSGNDYCSTAILTLGNSASYNYIACAGQDEVDHLLATATTPAQIIVTSAPATSAVISIATVTSTLSPTFTSAIVQTALSSTPTRLSGVSSIASSASTLTSQTSVTTSQTSTVTSSTAVSSSSSSPSSAPTQSPSNHVGAIVGGTIGGLALIAALIFGVIFLRRSRAHGEPDHRFGDNKSELPGDLPPPAYPVELSSGLQRSAHRAELGS